MGKGRRRLSPAEQERSAGLIPQFRRGIEEVGVEAEWECELSLTADRVVAVAKRELAQ